MHKGYWDSMKVAIKVCRVPSGQAAKAVSALMAQEIVLHASLDHVNVLPMLGYCRKSLNFYMVTPLMQGSVDNLLWPNEGECTLSQKQKLRICRCTAW